MIQKRKRLLSGILVCLLSICFNSVAFAAEAKNSTFSDFETVSISSDNENIITPRNQTIKSFQGEYSTILDIPFTVTDSSRPVRVLYAIRYANGSSVEVDLGLRNSSSSTWFWTRLDISGSSQVVEIGKLTPGNYVIRIIPNQASTYAISGQIYYYN